MLPAATPLKVEGTIRHPPQGETWEYSIVLAVRNGRGEEITRQVVGVGALAPEEVRSFSLAVELFVPQILGRDVRESRAASASAPAQGTAHDRPSPPSASRRSAIRAIHGSGRPWRGVIQAAPRHPPDRRRFRVTRGRRPVSRRCAPSPAAAAQPKDRPKD